MTVLSALEITDEKPPQSFKSDGGQFAMRDWMRLFGGGAPKVGDTRVINRRRNRWRESKNIFEESERFLFPDKCTH